MAKDVVGKQELPAGIRIKRYGAVGVQPAIAQQQWRCGRRLVVDCSSPARSSIPVADALLTAPAVLAGVYRT